MLMKNAVAASAVVLMSACLPPGTGVEAPYSAALQLPEDITLSWDQEYNETDDGIGALILLDLLVYDSDSGSPLDNIRVEVMSLWGGIYLIPKTAVKTVPGPEQPDPAECDADNNGEIDVDAPDSCSWFWDTSGDQYIQLSSEYAGGRAPNLMYGATDEHGLLRVHAYVDSMPASADSESGVLSFDQTGVWASIGHQSGKVLILTEGD